MKILKILDEKLEEYLMVAMVMLMTALIFIQVIMRYIFGNSLAWSEELSRYLFLWSIWLGASYGIKTQGHIRLTVLTSRLSPRIQDIVGVIVYIIWFLFVLFLVVKGYELVAKIYVSGQTSIALRLPMWIAYASVPVGCTLMSFRMLQNEYQVFKNRKGKKEVTE